MAQEIRLVYIPDTGKSTGCETPELQIHLNDEFKNYDEVARILRWAAEHGKRMEMLPQGHFFTPQKPQESQEPQEEPALHTDPDTEEEDAKHSG